MKEEKTVFYPYSSWLKQRYGEKVYKLPVNLPVSCPNRCDGHGGCTFCSEKGTGFESVWQPASVTEQMQHARDVVAKRYKARKFIAYFQNYTNTFMAMELFKAYLEEAAAFPEKAICRELIVRWDTCQELWLILTLFFLSLRKKPALLEALFF